MRAARLLLVKDVRLLARSRLLLALLTSPTLVLELGGGPLDERVRRQAEALVFNLNQRLQDVYIRQNVDYLGVLVRGGDVRFLGRDISVLGLDAARALVRRLQAEAPSGSRAEQELARVQNFARQATLALGQARASLEATARPVLLETRRDGDRPLGGELLGLALAVSLAVACPLLAAGALAL